MDKVTCRLSCGLVHIQQWVVNVEGASLPWIIRKNISKFLSRSMTCVQEAFRLLNVFWKTSSKYGEFKYPKFHNHSKPKILPEDFPDELPFAARFFKLYHFKIRRENYYNTTITTTISLIPGHFYTLLEVRKEFNNPYTDS